MWTVGWMVGDEVKMVPDESGNLVIMSHDASDSALAHDIMQSNIALASFIFLPHNNSCFILVFSILLLEHIEELKTH
jgi:hypothetical protein